MKFASAAVPKFRKRMHKALFSWLKENSPNHGIAVTLTFDPCRGTIHCNRSKAERTFREFMACVNRKTYRNAYSRFGKRLTVIPVLEGGGSTGKHYHYHVLIEVPHYMSEEEFIELLQRTWEGLPGTGNQNKVEKYRDSGWLRYMLKDRDKDDLLDAIDVGNLWLKKLTPMQRRASFGASNGKRGLSAPTSLMLLY